MSEWAVYDQHGQVISGGFMNKEAAAAWLSAFKHCAMIKKDDT